MKNSLQSKHIYLQNYKKVNNYVYKQNTITIG